MMSLCLVRTAGAAALAFGLMLAAVSIASAGDAGLGKKKAVMCQTCHGIDGIAKMPMAPNLAGENEIYLEAQLKAFRSGKRKNEMMSVVASQLSDDDIANLAAWYASIKITVTMPGE